MMQPQNDRIAKGCGLLFVAVFGSIGLGWVTFGALYLWPAFDPLGLHPNSYLTRALLSVWFIVPGAGFIGWSALVWHFRRRSRGNSPA
jgi:hypothetical protein